MSTLLIVAVVVVLALSLAIRSVTDKNTLSPVLESRHLTSNTILLAKDYGDEKETKTAFKSDLSPRTISDKTSPVLVFCTGSTGFDFPA